MINRYQELDSLRGIAALTVVFNHFINVVPSIYNANFSNGLSGYLLKVFTFSPVHIIWAGHEAVILFFVLSGFVLSLPFLNNKQGPYKDFLIKRLFRIYIPYIVAISIAIILRVLISRNGIDELGRWFNFAWTDPITLGQVINHVFIFGDFKNYIFDPVIWSLVHELRISLIFPFVMYFIVKCNYKICLLVAGVFSVSAYYVKTHILYNNGYIEYSTSNVDSMHYLSMFIIGALVAKHRDTIRRYFNNKLGNTLWFGIGVFLYTYPWWIFINNERAHKYIVNDWVISFGASIFIVLALYSNLFSRILNYNIFKFFGKISYSLYLFHSIVLLSFINLFYGILPYWSILVIALPSSILVSHLAYFFIEKPAMEYGRKLTKGKQRKLPF
jgi:peptidoglycan/LPS O-acetylase OafA/YrhL